MAAFLARLQRFFGMTARVASIEPAALTALLGRHGFSYWGYRHSGKGAQLAEDHFFGRDDCSFLFSFAFSVYGEDFIGVGAPIGAEPDMGSYVYLSYFVDYAARRNQLRESGLSHDQALAKVLENRVENVARVSKLTRDKGALVPSAADVASIRDVPGDVA